MNSDTPAGDGRRSGEQGLLALLFATVRPEWRHDIVVAPEEHPLFRLGGCRVADCAADGYTRGGLCRAHNLRWIAAGRPDADVWLTTQSGPTYGRAPLSTCLVPGCRFGRRNQRLCRQHASQWHRAGRPPIDAWAQSSGHDPIALVNAATCVVRNCELLTESTPPLCYSHQARWRSRLRAGHPEDLDTFLAHVDRWGKQHLDLVMLPPQLRLEIQYGLQCRADEGKLRTRLEAFGPVVRFLTAAGAHSLTDRTPQQWRDAARSAPGCGSIQLGFITHCCEFLDILHHGAGWDVEYPRDVWRLSRLGYDAPYENLRFTRIPQLWLRELAKRWVRHRLAVGMAMQTVYLSLTAAAHLGTYLDGSANPPTDAGALTRDHLERWLAHLSATVPDPSTRLAHITNIRVFLQEVHRREWAPELAASCMLHPEDNPKLPETAPRALPEFVMRQLETPEQLDRYRDPAMRTITEIMIHCGLRGKDARGLEFDCMVRDGEGHPYLRYLNHKMQRTAFVPLDERLVGAVKAQQDRVLARYPQGCPRLFPQANMNPDGSKPVGHTTWFNRTQEWLEAVQLVDEHSRPVRFKAHQWRHTFATRLINLDVPQHIVQRLLDHSSPEMTAHYARLRDEKLREAWAKVRKINVRGEVVELDTEHPLADAAWTRAGLAQAKQTLPNGYCGMPIHSPCEHANPCLTCPLFLTTPEFLPQHRTQRAATLELIGKAEADGHGRVAEKNKQVLGNLDRIINACESCGTDQIVVGGTPRDSRRRTDAG